MNGAESSPRHLYLTGWNMPKLTLEKISVWVYIYHNNTKGEKENERILKRPS